MYPCSFSYVDPAQFNWFDCNKIFCVWPKQQETQRGFKTSFIATSNDLHRQTPAYSGSSTNFWKSKIGMGAHLTNPNRSTAVCRQSPAGVVNPTLWAAGN